MSKTIIWQLLFLHSFPNLLQIAREVIQTDKYRGMEKLLTLAKALKSKTTTTTKTYTKTWTQNTSSLRVQYLFLVAPCKSRNLVFSSGSNITHSFTKYLMKASINDHEPALFPGPGDTGNEWVVVFLPSWFLQSNHLSFWLAS